MIETSHEDIKEIKTIMGEIRGDLAMMKSDLGWIATMIDEMRADVRGFAIWMLACSLILSAFCIFGTICFLTNFSFFTPAG